MKVVDYQNETMNETMNEMTNFALFVYAPTSKQENNDEKQNDRAARAQANVRNGSRHDSV